MSQSCGSHSILVNGSCSCAPGWWSESPAGLECEVNETAWLVMHIAILTTFGILLLRCAYVHWLLCGCRCRLLKWVMTSSANVTRSRSHARLRADKRISCALVTFHGFQLLLAVAGIGRFSLALIRGHQDDQGTDVMVLNAFMVAAWASSMGAIPGLFFVVVQSQLGWAAVSGASVQMVASERRCSLTATILLLFLIWSAIAAVYIGMSRASEMVSTLHLWLAAFIVSIGVLVCLWWAVYVLWIIRSIRTLLNDQTNPVAPMVARDLRRVTSKLGCSLILILLIAVLLAIPIPVYLEIKYFAPRSYLLVFPAIQVLAVVSIYLSFLFRPKSRNKNFKVTMLTDLTSDGARAGVHAPLLSASITQPHSNSYHPYTVHTHSIYPNNTRGAQDVQGATSSSAMSPPVSGMAPVRIPHPRSSTAITATTARRTTARGQRRRSTRTKEDDDRSSYHTSDNTNTTHSHSHADPSVSVSHSRRVYDGREYSDVEREDGGEDIEEEQPGGGGGGGGEGRRGPGGGGGEGRRGASLPIDEEYIEQLLHDAQDQELLHD